MRISIDWRELAAQVLAYLLGCLSWVTAAEPSKTRDLLRRDLAAMARMRSDATPAKLHFERRARGADPNLLAHVAMRH